MDPFHWVDPDFRDLVARHELDDLDAVLARGDSGRVPPFHRDRDTLRLELENAAGQVQTLYLKRERTVKWRHLVRHALGGHGLWTPVRAEFEALRRLTAAGVSSARPIACVERVGYRPQGCLLLAALPDCQTLSAYLAGPLRDAAAAVRESFFTLLGEQVARLHACQIHQPHLYSNHLFVSGAAPACSIWFLGFRRSWLYRALPFPKRAYDVAALMATLPRRLATEREREAFHDAYLHAAELEHRGMEFIQSVARHVEQLLTHRKIWEIRESDTDEHRAVRPLESVERGQMWIDRAFRGALEQAGLASFDAMLATQSGRCLRTLPDRENWRLELHPPHQSPCGAYLKKHHIRTARTRLRARLGAGPGVTPGRVEAQNVARLSRSGIAAMRLIAYGEKLHHDGRLESFVLTEELAGYEQLDHFLRRRFPSRDTTQCTPRDQDLLRLIREVAAAACKLHKLGYNHRDLYCCHFFIQESPQGQFKVNLIDLQRVEHRRHFRSRWLVKDLAQLAYSAPREQISCTHRLAFIKWYLGVDKLRPQDKRFIRRIMAKQRIMEQTLGPAQ
jgi:heptose I phosphotransferase